MVEVDGPTRGLPLAGRVLFLLIEVPFVLERPIDRFVVVVVPAPPVGIALSVAALLLLVVETLPPVVVWLVLAAELLVLVAKVVVLMVLVVLSVVVPPEMVAVGVLEVVVILFVPMVALLEVEPAAAVVGSGPMTTASEVCVAIVPVIVGRHWLLQTNGGVSHGQPGPRATISEPNGSLSPNQLFTSGQTLVKSTSIAKDNRRAAQLV